MSHQILRRLGAGVPLAAALLAITAGSASAVAIEGQRNFTDPGCGGDGGVTANEFKVPRGVTKITVAARGGVGEGSSLLPGGNGADISTDLAVTTNQVLYFCVEQGGGAGGIGGSGGITGPKGGGYASVSKHADSTSPLVIAGGGGGRGIATVGNTTSFGGVAGFNGGTAGSGTAANGLTPASGASASVPGTGGTNPGDAAADGHAGVAQTGGAGGDGVGQGAGGAGGGGGLYGGGGGAGSIMDAVQGGGGGGGSSFCSVTCSYDGYWVQASEIVVTWDAKPLIDIDHDLDFGNVPVGSTSAAKTVKLTNVGTATASFAGTSMIFGSNPTDFAVVVDGCSQATLAPNDSCSIDLVFKPTTSGARSAAVLFPNSGSIAGRLPGLSGVGGSSDPVTNEPPVTGVPVPPTSSQPPATDSAPVSDTCASRRVVELRIPSRFRGALRSATATIAGKTVATFRDGEARLDLSGRAAGKVKVKIAMKLRGGRTRTDVRTYSLCVPAKNRR